MSFMDRLEALWEGFKEQARKHVLWFVAVILAEELFRDRFAGWINDRVSDTTLGDVLLWFVDSPFILLVVLVGVLLILSYRQKFGPSGEAGGAPSMPSWLEKVVEHDRINLQSTLHQVDPERQYGNVSFYLDAEREPSIVIQFLYVNASIFAVRLASVEGILQVDHREMPGAFKFKPLQVSRNSLFGLTLKFVISTDAAVRDVRNMINEGEEICIDLNNVRMRLEADDAEVAPAELRFSAQQFWRAPETRTAEPAPAATMESNDQ